MIEVGLANAVEFVARLIVRGAIAFQPVGQIVARGFVLLARLRELALRGLLFAAQSLVFRPKMNETNVPSDGPDRERRERGRQPR